MLARSAVRFAQFSKVQVRSFPKVTVAVRAMGGHAAADHSHGHDAKPSDDVVIPDLVDTLEWTLDSPPNVHQFDEPPIVVEIEHLKNLKRDDTH